MRSGHLKSELPIGALLLLAVATWWVIRIFPRPPASP
jgi:hypothetical protein